MLAARHGYNNIITKEWREENNKERRWQQIAKRFLYNHFFRYVLAIFPRLQYTEFGSAPDPEHLQDMRKYVAIWFSWFGHTFWRKVYLLDPEDRNF